MDRGAWQAIVHVVAKSWTCLTDFFTFTANVYWASLVAQWLRIRPPMQETPVWSITGWGRSPGEVNGNLVHYPCLGNPMNRGVWWATVYGVTKETQLSDLIKTTMLYSLGMANTYLHNENLNCVLGNKHYSAKPWHLEFMPENCAERGLSVPGMLGRLFLGGETYRALDSCLLSLVWSEKLPFLFIVLRP